MPTFSTIDWPEFPRAQMRSHLLRTANVPENRVDEVVDIAFHAAQSGRATMLRILDSADDAVANTAIGIAASLLKGDLETLIDSLRAAARATGRPYSEGKIGSQAHG